MHASTATPRAWSVSRPVRDAPSGADVLYGCVDWYQYQAAAHPASRSAPLPAASRVDPIGQDPSRQGTAHA
jgi:hypothetical protein